ncbi:Crp/Fnr family transcriptional regulator [bacterium SCSIO 12643]|nr:Crp/Fnr family transcriptional regulator [bacterium SCSIO 12643]
MDLFAELKLRIDQYPIDIWEKDITVLRNGYLKVPGTKDTNVYFIEEGSLRIILEREEEEITFRFAYNGNFISALDSYISEKPSDFGIKAIKKSKVRVIKKSNFVQFLESNSAHQKLWQDLMNGVILDQGERELDLLTSSPKERYLRVLKRNPKLFQIVPGKYIASYLRMTPETFTRLKKS